ncbi:MAG: hypothetical protein RLZZ196_251 [Bacteroidota bacterium]|jgi:hypothetical protein
MTEEVKQPLSVSDMLRRTGENTAEFMNHVAQKFEELEVQVEQLKTRVQELEASNGPK